ncbi:hypothetical protein GGR56DRAFT_686193 [Xylariaceae sp. FL0804]|nr:hypothetical protein GGR56DRAFT_686193 [Xylariaceae sp. FL0804]
MAAGDLIDFDVIEGQKENIQSLPGGRSAKKLAEVFSPSPLQQLATPNPSDTKNINDCIRAEYDAEVANLSESDDPLDVFDRYVRWTFDAYPSAQATPQSQLHTLLERATKAFIGAPQYRNDPRYLRLWLHYVRLFSDSPRETFVFLSRHGIGEGLALFYEEYAAWLEGAGRWGQADEVYRLGVEREARPVQRLARKHGEFAARREQLPDAAADAPSSPALPSVRPALMAKIDPYAAAAARAADPQAPRPNMGVGGQSSKPSKSKLTIFSDTDSAQPAVSAMGEGAKGWDTIGSLADRKKENVVEAKPWVGETLATTVKKSSAPKMAVFRDPSLSRIAESHIVIAPSKHQVIVNPQSGKRERIFVQLEAIYPTPEEPGTELSFEELWAASRGWLDVNWDDESIVERQGAPADENVPEVDLLSRRVAEKLVVHQDVAMFDENGAIKEQPKAKGRKKKVMEVNATQTIKANLDSPSGPKIKKKRNATSEPTMTMHTRAATDEIYELFNAPLQPAPQEDEAADTDDDDMTDGDYTSGAESTGTTRQMETTSEAGDFETGDDKSVSGWSDFTARKHIPKLDGRSEADVVDDDGDSQMSDNQDSDVEQADDEHEQEHDHEHEQDETGGEVGAHMSPDDTPLERARTRFIPLPPEDYDPPTRPYRDPAEVANNRLPFMTPITERTETSLGVVTARAFTTRPPSRDTLDTPTEEDEDDDEEFEPMSSPLREILSGPRASVAAFDSSPSPAKKKTAQHPRGPIITDMLCNPVAAAVRDEILARMQPPLSSHAGFFDHRGERCDRGAEIRRFAKAVGKTATTTTRKSCAGGGSSNSGDKTGPVQAPPVLEFPELMADYTVRRELGAGAFAPVYLIENSSPDEGEEEVEEGDEGEEHEEEVEEEDEDAAYPVARTTTTTRMPRRRRARLEALKMEQPPTAWEFHMMRLAAARLGPRHRAAASVSAAHELHLYQDEGFLVLPYHAHGTLLDVVNHFREQQQGAMDEPLAVFFAVELLRTVEALHARGIMHGDLKADNCLLRLANHHDHVIDGGGEQHQQQQQQQTERTLSSQWRADGSGGWAALGVVLIDFGRAIDVRAFAPGARFVADWKTTGADCAEMRDGRPWTWQIDYHGLAGILHCLLFGRYMETVPVTATATASSRNSGNHNQNGGSNDGVGSRQQQQRYRLREPLKRYWQVDIWARCFDVLLNPAAHVQQTQAGDGDGDCGGDGHGLPDTNTDAALPPVTHALRAVRHSMEAWLEANCERGIGLRGMMARVEAAVRGRR